ncbi:MAG: hypothetical protein ACREOZ_05210, partial [Gloeomargaritales cyanobacterium]
SKPRVKTENCNGICKGIFPYLRNLRLRLKGDVRSMKRLLRIVLATAVLHNLLINHNLPDKWIDEIFPAVEGDPVSNELLEGIRGDEKRSLIHNFLLLNSQLE